MTVVLPVQWLKIRESIRTAFGDRNDVVHLPSSVIGGSVIAESYPRAACIFPQRGRIIARDHLCFLPYHLNGPGVEDRAAGRPIFSSKQHTFFLSTAGQSAVEQTSQPEVTMHEAGQENEGNICQQSLPQNRGYHRHLRLILAHGQSAAGRP